MKNSILTFSIIIFTFIFVACGNAENQTNDDETAKKALTEYLGQLQEIVNYYNNEYSNFTVNMLYDSTISNKSALEKKEKELNELFKLNKHAEREYKNRFNGDYLRLFLIYNDVSESSADQIVKGFNKSLEENRNYTLELFAVQRNKISTLSILTRVLQNNFDSYKLEGDELVFSNKQIEKRVNELVSDYEKYSANEKELIKSANNAASNYFGGQQ